MSETPLGTFEEHVLLTVLRVEHAFGMEVRRELERRTDRELSIGAVYATLDRLEAKGMVRSRREDIDGKSRRVFVVEPSGVDALRTTRSVRNRLWSGIELPGEA